MAELTGKDFIYSRVLLRCALVGAMCADNVLELEGGCGLKSLARISCTLGLSYAVYLLIHRVRTMCLNQPEPGRASQGQNGVIASEDLLNNIQSNS